ncbi:Two-component system protein B [Fusarium oxysporum f. sp. albedinis]|nr:Two-component system protein B [Fusarium oxysporum f. sp. albedinis]
MVFFSRSNCRSTQIYTSGSWLPPFLTIFLLCSQLFRSINEIPHMTWRSARAKIPRCNACQVGSISELSFLRGVEFSELTNCKVAE